MSKAGDLRHPASVAATNRTLITIARKITITSKLRSLLSTKRRGVILCPITIRFADYSVPEAE